MKGFETRLAMSALAMGAALAAASPAAAQSTATWVSGVGDDANPCSRASPCRTFAGALAKTAAGGQIACLDPGSFGSASGSVTITKSVTIDCESVPATVAVATSGGTGISVNAGSGIVVLRGITVDGGGVGTYGIRVFQAARVEVYNSSIVDFSCTNCQGITLTPGAAGVKLVVGNATITNNSTGINSAPTGTSFVQAIIENSEISGNLAAGISFNAGSQAGTLVVRNSSVSNNVGGISLQSNAGGGIVAVVDNVLVNGNSGNGINASASIGSVKANVSRSTISNNNNGVLATNSFGASAVSVTDSVISYNAGGGAVVNGTASQVWLSGNAIIGNGTGTQVASGTMYTYGDNRIIANSAATMTPATKQ